MPYLLICVLTTASSSFHDNHRNNRVSLFAFIPLKFAQDTVNKVGNCWKEEAQQQKTFPPRLPNDVPTAGSSAQPCIQLRKPPPVGRVPS